MNERQREYFRRKLIAWRESILAESRDTLNALQLESENHPDIADRASSETDRAIELRARDRQRKLISKIEAALARIDDGSYGYCIETGEPISLRRLDARPIATLSVEAQERHERREKIYRDDPERPSDRRGLNAAFRGRAGAPSPLRANRARRTDRRPSAGLSGGSRRGRGGRARPARWPAGRWAMARRPARRPDRLSAPT